MTQPDFSMTRRDFVRSTGLVAGATLTAALGGIGQAETADRELPRRVLGKTGVSLPLLTLGTAPCGFAQPPSPKNVAECVRTALECGVMSIDTAPAYAVAEEGVGLGLGSRRKDVFLATKVMADTIADAEKSLTNSLRKLKTDCLDLVYYHNLGDRKLEGAMEAEGVFTWLVQ